MISIRKNGYRKSTGDGSRRREPSPVDFYAGRDHMPADEKTSRELFSLPDLSISILKLSLNFNSIA